jgi:hypothetical protein
LTVFYNDLNSSVSTKVEKLEFEPEFKPVQYKAASSAAKNLNWGCNKQHTYPSLENLHNLSLHTKAKHLQGLTIETGAGRV